MASQAGQAPSTGQGALEIGALLLLGAAHASLARSWLASPALPGLFILVASALRSLSERGELSILAYGSVIAIPLLLLALHRLHDRIPQLLMGTVFALIGAIGSRYLALSTPEISHPLDLLQTELRAPWEHARQSLEPIAEGPPVVLITVDTLRWDHAEEMESWKRLQTRGATWPRAMSTSSWTLPALGSLWTGTAPEIHDAGKGFSAIRPGVPMVSELLVDRGYRTAAFMANSFLTRNLGFARGFQTWMNPDEHLPQPLAILGFSSDLHRRDGQEVMDDALDWLEDAPDQGWLLWVHLFDPHLPHSHSPNSPSQALQDLYEVRDGRADLTPERVSAFAESYATEVAYADSQILRLLDALDARGFWSEGTLVFTSDHGEELWDHGGFEHGHSHHTEVIDVPLALVSPGLDPGERDGVASLVDIAPTLAAITGLDQPSGIDLRQEIPDDRIATAAGNFYGLEQRSARSKDTRVILTDHAQQAAAQAWNLERDPLEQRPIQLEVDHPVLQAARAVKIRSGDPSKVVVLSESRLRELGYLE
jgi:arylsulfatase A-like enzyme